MPNSWSVMSLFLLNLRKKIGFAVLGIVMLYWLAFPIIPFIEMPNKLVVIPVVAVIGELLFIIAIALLGKEYWGRIKTLVHSKFSRAHED